MKHLFSIDPWKIIQEGFQPEINRIAESVFSIGNGKMGQRANFEEDFSGDSLQGSYIAGVYYPDKTRVGWWKNGYPEYFAKVLNAVNWIGLHIKVDDQILDLNNLDLHEFKRELDMQEGILRRTFVVSLTDNKKIRIKAERFLSMHQDELGVLSYSIEALNDSINIELTSYLDFDIRNEDANYDEKFWDKLTEGIDKDYGFVAARTKKTAFSVESCMRNRIFLNGKEQEAKFECLQEELKVGHRSRWQLKKGDYLELQKFTATCSSFYYPVEDLHNSVIFKSKAAAAKGYDELKTDHKLVWKDKWEKHDIIIQGDTTAQQAMRFNIFQLNQTYTGKDERLNIGPKGFTGEKYGGSTYWDTEAYCIPFYQSSAEQEISTKLLLYRYKHLPKAIENAEKLGFSGGAALYPMVTMNGEECHNEWEITFEEIHRNGAIAYAIYNYSNYYNDIAYLLDYGVEVLLAIARFWAQRFSWSANKQQYVMLGVTGPNEFENNVNNNWYTSFIAKWCMEYCIESIALLKDTSFSKYEQFAKKTFFKEEETLKWQEICSNIYFPKDEQKNIFLQQDGFLDKELIPASEIPGDQLPIVHNWSWDRILRSPYIKQADVLQGMFFFDDHFSLETVERHYDFYEPFTVHESSLSPCIHAIIAARIGRPEEAYNFFLRTARLDLDNVNEDSDDGCHITSMAGTWMAFTKGIGGMNIKNGTISFNPLLPKALKAYQFNVLYRGAKLFIEVDNKEVKIEMQGKKELDIFLYDQLIKLKDSNKQQFTIEHHKV